VAPQWLVLVSSRRRLVAVDSAHLLPLDMLDQVEAHELLVSRLVTSELRRLSGWFS
jgi:hypothetical protein